MCSDLTPNLDSKVLANIDLGPLTLVWVLGSVRHRSGSSVLTLCVFDFSGHMFQDNMGWVGGRVVLSFYQISVTQD